MTDNSDRYYRSAGAIPTLGIILMLAAGSIAAVVCGALYAAADWYIAYDIVPILCAPLAGVSIGAAVKFGAMAGGARHRGFLALVGLAMGLLGAFCSWIVFLRIWDGAGFWVWDPSILVVIINEISELGVWERQPTGVILKLIYGVETLSIMVCAAIVATMETRPFCDACNRWTEEVAPVAVLKSTDHEILREKLEDSRYEALDELFDPAVDPANCLHAKLFMCPECNESNYLVVSHVTVEEKKGEMRTSEDVFIKHLWVPEDVQSQLCQLDDHLQQATIVDAGASASDADATDDPDAQA